MYTEHERHQTNITMLFDLTYQRYTKHSNVTICMICVVHTVNRLLGVLLLLKVLVYSIALDMQVNVHMY